MREKVCRSSPGFTLIELMIVVANIGILAAVAIPKFANMLRKSRESTTKGNLGALRSAISIYSADTEDFYPAEDAGQTPLSSLIPKYLEKIPNALVPDHHPADNGVLGSLSAGCAVIFLMDDGRWLYCNEPDRSYCGGSVVQPNWGQVWIACNHTDTKNLIVSNW